ERQARRRPCFIWSVGKYEDEENVLKTHGTERAEIEEMLAKKQRRNRVTED
ncbi:pre-mRNA splicing factor prp17, partial [Culex quinquefasciatus]